MGVAVLSPESCLRDGFPHQNRHLISAPRSKPRRSPVKNRSVRRKPQWSPDRSPSPEPKPSSQSSGLFRILKRGEVLTPLEQSTTPISPVNDQKTKMCKLPSSAPLFYAGSAFFTSPPPSSVPLPVFCTKNKSSAEDATFDLRRILRLE